MRHLVLALTLSLSLGFALSAQAGEGCKYSEKQVTASTEAASEDKTAAGCSECRHHAESDQVTAHSHEAARSEPLVKTVVYAPFRAIAAALR